MEKSEECNIIGKRYFGYASHTSVFRTRNPFDDIPEDSQCIHLCACAREGCDRVETLSTITTEKKPTIEELMAGKETITDTKQVITSFPRCPICLTKYCSKECQILDHRHGKHKEKCRMFKYMKEHCESDLCDKCWKSKWTILSDPHKGGLKLSATYTPCRKCFKKEINMDTNIPSDISCDPDIKRVWLQ